MKKAEFEKQKKQIQVVLDAMHKGLIRHEAIIEHNFRNNCDEHIDKAHKHFAELMCEKRDESDFRMNVRRPNFDNYLKEVHGWGMNTHKEYYKHPMFFLRWSDLRRTDEVEALIKREISDHLKILRGKLEQSLCRQTLKYNLNIKLVETVSINISSQGFEGCFKLTEKDGTTKMMDTHSIYAGGYNIQRLHFRYLTTIK